MLTRLLGRTLTSRIESVLVTFPYDIAGVCYVSVKTGKGTRRFVLEIEVDVCLINEIFRNISRSVKIINPESLCTSINLPYFEKSRDFEYFVRRNLFMGSRKMLLIFVYWKS